MQISPPARSMMVFSTAPETGVLAVLVVTIRGAVVGLGVAEIVAEAVLSWYSEARSVS